MPYSRALWKQNPNYTLQVIRVLNTLFFYKNLKSESMHTGLSVKVHTMLSWRSGKDHIFCVLSAVEFLGYWTNFDEGFIFIIQNIFLNRY